MLNDVARAFFEAKAVLAMRDGHQEELDNRRELAHMRNKRIAYMNAIAGEAGGNSTSAAEPERGAIVVGC